MLTTDAGMVTLANALQPLKAFASMLVTVDGILIVLTLVLADMLHPWSDSVVVPARTLTSIQFNELHPSNAPFPTVATEDGIVTLVKADQR